VVGGDDLDGREQEPPNRDERVAPGLGVTPALRIVEVVERPFRAVAQLRAGALQRETEVVDLEPGDAEPPADCFGDNALADGG
jgi:hypothetical protein